MVTVIWQLLVRDLISVLNIALCYRTKLTIRQAQLCSWCSSVMIILRSPLKRVIYKKRKKSFKGESKMSLENLLCMLLLIL